MRKELRTVVGMATKQSPTKQTQKKPTGARKGRPQWLNADQAAAWRAFIDTLTPLQQVLEAAIEPFGLTNGDYEVLVRLSEQPDHRMRMCDLAAELGLSPSGLTRRLDGLVRDGIVTREPSGTDKRVMLAVLSDDGYTLLKNAAPSHVDAVRRNFIDLLTDDEVAALRSAFVKIFSQVS